MAKEELCAQLLSQLNKVSFEAFRHISIRPLQTLRMGRGLVDIDLTVRKPVSLHVNSEHLCDVTFSSAEIRDFSTELSVPPMILSVLYFPWVPSRIADKPNRHLPAKALVQLYCDELPCLTLQVSWCGSYGLGNTGVWICGTWLELEDSQVLRMMYARDSSLYQ